MFISRISHVGKQTQTAAHAIENKKKKHYWIALIEKDNIESFPASITAIARSAWLADTMRPGVL